MSSGPRKKGGRAAAAALATSAAGSYVKVILRLRPQARRLWAGHGSSPFTLLTDGPAGCLYLGGGDPDDDTADLVLTMLVHGPHARGLNGRPVEQIQREAIRIGVLVDDLLLLARLDQGRPLVREEVDLAVLDVTMPRMSGLQAAHELSRRVPSLRILMLSMHHNEQYFLEALRAGAGGYVLKSVADHDLIRACRAVMRGEPFMYPDSERRMLGSALELAGDAGIAQLTRRESEIMALVAEGHTTREIAEMLVISPRTVDRHRDNLLDKLNLRNRIELTRYAIRAGLIEP